MKRINLIDAEETQERRQNRDVRSVIEEFMASDYICQEIDWNLHYASPYSCTNALNRSIEAAGRKSQCIAVTQNKKVFLKKKMTLTLKPATLEQEHEDKEEETHFNDFVEEAPSIIKPYDKPDKINFIEVDPKVIARRKSHGGRRSKYEKLIEEFVDAEIAVANVPYKAHAKTPASMCQQIRKYIKKMNLADIVKVIRFDGDVYLINIPMMEKLEAK